MSKIRHENLESTQSYISKGIHGHKPEDDREPEPEGFLCALCLEVEVKDEGEYCAACAAEEAEYRRGQSEDR